MIVPISTENAYTYSFPSIVSARGTPITRPMMIATFQKTGLSAGTVKRS